MVLAAAAAAAAAVFGMVVTVVGAEETALSHRTEQDADEPPLDVAERGGEAHARLGVLDQVSCEMDGGVPEVAEEAAEAVEERVFPR